MGKKLLGAIAGGILLLSSQHCAAYEPIEENLYEARALSLQEASDVQAGEQAALEAMTAQAAAVAFIVDPKHAEPPEMPKPKVLGDVILEELREVLEKIAGPGEPRIQEPALPRPGVIHNKDIIKTAPTEPKVPPPPD